MRDRRTPISCANANVIVLTPRLGHRPRRPEEQAEHSDLQEGRMHA